MSGINMNGIKYKLSGGLNDFQKRMQIHLVNWKWKHITEEPGEYAGNMYDSRLPLSVTKDFPHIYKSVLGVLKEHQLKYPFKFHKHFWHMASSQAANINLFLPVLLHNKASDILRIINPDIKSIATDYLYKGFRIEFWDGNSNKETGLLNDHSAIAGTDSDIAIAYYNNENELCLWLIEHKLTEAEFTECGGYKSKWNKKKHFCKKPFNDILKNKNLCYYHDVRKFNYWDITDLNKSFFVNADKHDECPFKGGMNQLWRNQLLGLALEKEKEYKHVYFSVVKHPDNTSLDKSINEYKALINNNPKFSVFTSLDVINAAKSVNDTSLDKWIKWYEDLYKI